MENQPAAPKGPDLTAGVPASSLSDDVPLLGHVGGEAVLLVRSAGTTFAVGATCAHYGGPLAEGLVVDGTVRCPWHHACFDLQTGAARGPALASIPCFEVIAEGDAVRVGARKQLPAPSPRRTPSSVVVVGGGVAGAACIETLRREGYTGRIALVADEPPGAVDRPNLSKDYLAGTAPEEWTLLRGEEAWRAADVDVHLGAPATVIDVHGKLVRLHGGQELSYGALLLATGAEPVLPTIDGADLPHVFRLRTLADSKAIIARAARAKKAVVLGASFIGLEAAASLRQRGVDVTVVAPDAVPLAAFGPEVGAYVRALHEQHGVAFRLGRMPSVIREDSVLLDDAAVLPADLVVVGIGVRPRIRLAQEAGLAVDNGVITDNRLRTSNPDVYAAGDIARFPYRGHLVRIEHFALAVRQGQYVARSMLGHDEPFRDVPFFWSQHYDASFCYVGHGGKWEQAELDGSLEARDATVVYRQQGRVAAVATLFRDRLSLDVERAMEQGDDEAVESLVRKPS